MFEKLEHCLALWYARLKYWYAVWHVGLFIGTLAHKNSKLARFWRVKHAGTQARYVNHADTKRVGT